MPIETTNQSIKPPVFYRYMDEQGNVLKISSTAPSELRPTITGESPSNVKSRTAEPTYFHSRYIAVEDERRHFVPENERHTAWPEEPKLPTTITRKDFELLDKRIPKVSERPSSITRAIPVNYEYQYPIKPSTHENIQLSWLPLSYQLEQSFQPTATTGYDSDSSESDRSTLYRSYDYTPAHNRSHHKHRPLFQKTHPSTHSPTRSYYPPPARLPLSNRGISPDFSTNNVSRNYIEVFRDGENQPSEVYSLPFEESIPLTQRHSRLDQYQSDKYQRKHHTSSSPTTKPTKIIPSISNHEPYSPQTVQSSPNRQDGYLNNYLRHSKSFDYRPLRTKLQREYKVTPSLLVDEWEQTPFPSTSTTDTNLRPSVSSPDDVFISLTNRTNKA